MMSSGSIGPHLLFSAGDMMSARQETHTIGAYGTRKIRSRNWRTQPKYPVS